MLRNTLKLAMRYLRAKLIHALDPTLRIADERRLEIREAKKQFWLGKATVRKGQGRRKIRQNMKIKAGQVRQKFEKLRIFDPNEPIQIPEGFELHHGRHEIGLWQIEFLKKQGLKPGNTLIDIGCGDLKGGVPILRYLDADNYTGVDQNPVAIKQGVLSLDGEDRAKFPNFYVGGDFGLEILDESFDFAWAHSVFTHVDLSMCGKCMASVYQTLKPGGVFLATFFPAHGSEGWRAIKSYRKDNKRQRNVEKHTYSYRNPFHHNRDILIEIAKTVGFKSTVLYTEHPKGQSILRQEK